MSRRGLAAAAAVLAVLAPAGQTRPLEPARRVVLVLAPGASLADWRRTDTPVLRRLTETAPLGVIPTRAAGTDPLAPYRALGAGARSPSPKEAGLGATLHAAGVRVVALGGEGARALAGLTGGAAGEPWRVRRASSPWGVATDPLVLARAARRALEAAGDQPVFATVLFDDLARADAYAAFALPRATTEQRRDARRRLDGLLGALTAPGVGATVLLVTPRPSAEAAARRERLGPVLLWRGEAARVRGAALLTSPSTRRTPGLVAATDVAATVAALFDLPPGRRAVGVGRPMETLDPPSHEPSAAYLARRVAAWAAQAREQRLLVGVPWALAGALLALAWLSTRSGATERVWRLAHALAAWAVSVPAALLLAAALSPEAPGLPFAVYALASVLSLPPPLLTLRFPARRVVTAVCAATALVLAADGFLGSPLLGRSPFSYSVIEAARFYGIGNEAAGALLGSALVASSAARALAHRWPKVAVALAGIAVAGVLGLPGLGADLGGLLAAVTGFATLALASGRPVTRRQLALSAALCAAAVAGFVLWEAARDAPSRTHIGQAVAAARARGGGALVEIAGRKATLGARLLVTSPWAALLLAEVFAAVWLLRRPPGRPGAPSPGGRPDADAPRAIAAAAAAALLVNDSGVVAAATCLLYGVPLLALARTASPPPAGDRRRSCGRSAR